MGGDPFADEFADVWVNLAPLEQTPFNESKSALKALEDLGFFCVDNLPPRLLPPLAELVVEVTGSSSEIVHLPLPEDDPMQRRPDLTKARSLLGWEPTIQLREGLERTAEYFASRIV